ncbi:MAG: ferrous iron transport protein B [Bacilli bacterium]|nr:ferrous iron transport protein B [Bacilli bacterium]
MNNKIALIGNPNVGKSTIFNTLTGKNEHTGNWPGKTVGNAVSNYTYNNKKYIIYDLPGTYSLISHSKEEEIARNFICSKDYDIALVVCDAVCLERNLNLVLQILEITSNVIVCVNLMDEARKKKITIDLDKLSDILKVPVVGTSARSNIGINNLLKTIENFKPNNERLDIKYDMVIENAIKMINVDFSKLNKRWLSIKLLDDDKNIIDSLKEITGEEFKYNNIDAARKYLTHNNINDLKDEIGKTMISKAEEIAKEVVTFEDENYTKKDRRLDKILTNKYTGIPIMLISLLIIFWITITGANYPSKILYDFLFKIEDILYNFLTYINLPNFLVELLIHGVYRVTAWVVSVMLPPMAIFFPLFALLEDYGVLPRIAFNLDKLFKKCNACGKQALTMCMGFGCNAAGVTGARIIDSKRERLIAIITNNFVPCNGRFPTIISIITMFFIGLSCSLGGSILSALILTIIILFGIIMTFIVSKVLSKTLLKGMPSSFALELPPYRKPQFFKVIIRSIYEKTLKILLRAISVAAPAGLLIWLFSNIDINGISILNHLTSALDPFGKAIGLDGTILMGFILGFPANEIVIPIILMGYLGSSTMSDFNNLTELKNILITNGWTIKTAICTIIFSLMHFPCSTTVLTIKKETNSYKWAIISILIPTIIGITLCFVISNILNFFI